MRIKNFHLGCACASDVLLFFLGPSRMCSCRYATWRSRRGHPLSRSCLQTSGTNLTAHFAFVFWFGVLSLKASREREQRHNPERRPRGLHTGVPGLSVDAPDFLLDPGRYFL